MYLVSFRFALSHDPWGAIRLFSSEQDLSRFYSINFSPENKFFRWPQKQSDILQKCSARRLQFPNHVRLLCPASDIFSWMFYDVWLSSFVSRTAHSRIVSLHRFLLCFLAAKV